MQRKILLIGLAVLSSLISAFSLSACDLFNYFEDGKPPVTQAPPDNTDDKGATCDHSYTDKITNSTQTEKGKIVYTCSKYGKEKVTVLATLAEGNYPELERTVTCVKDGYIKYAVWADNATRYIIVDAKATGIHDWRGEKCAMCGAATPGYISHTHSYANKEYDETGHWFVCVCGERSELVKHEYSKEYEFDATRHWFICSVENETSISEAHKWDSGKVTQEATCYAQGIKIFTCTLCSQTKNDNILTIDHTWGDWQEDGDAHNRTCTVSGCTQSERKTHNYDGNTCKDCNAQKPAEEKLAYELNSSGAEYVVIGIGTVTSKHVVVPATYDGKPVMSIKEGLFKDVPKINLTEITIPASIKSIGYLGDFDGLKVNYQGTLEQWAQIPLASPHFSPGALSLWSYSLYIGEQHITNVELNNVPEVTDIFKCSDITSIKLGSKVKSLRRYAFSYCKQLETAEIADGVKVPGCSGIFTNCEKLVSVKIPNDIEVIDHFMINSCKSLTTITIPASCKRINEYSFSGS